MVSIPMLARAWTHTCVHVYMHMCAHAQRERLVISLATHTAAPMQEAGRNGHSGVPEKSRFHFRASPPLSRRFLAEGRSCHCCRKEATFTDRKTCVPWVGTHTHWLQHTARSRPGNSSHVSQQLEKWADVKNPQISRVKQIKVFSYQVSQTQLPIFKLCFWALWAIRQCCLLEVKIWI